MPCSHLLQPFPFLCRGSPDCLPAHTLHQPGLSTRLSLLWKAHTRLVFQPFAAIISVGFVEARARSLLDLPLLTDLGLSDCSFQFLLLPHSLNPIFQALGNAAEDGPGSAGKGAAAAPLVKGSDSPADSKGSSFSLPWELLFYCHYMGKLK